MPSKNTTNRVRIGFIGVGSIAQQHLRILTSLETAQPVAFCDVDKARAAQAAARFAHFEARHYGDYRKMLDAEALDAVYVCVPPHAHKEMELLIAQKGCALFVEKPIGLSLAAAERAAQAIENAGIISSVGYHFRYHAAVAQAQTLLAQAPPVALVTGRWLSGVPAPPWWRRQNQSGGQLHEQATHIIDLARYLVGDISKVFCTAARREPKAMPGGDIADVSLLSCEFASGAIGNFSASCLLEGAAEIDLQLLRKGELLDLRGNHLTRRRTGEVQTFSHGNDPFHEENAAFLDAVISGQRRGLKSTYADALKTLRVTLAAAKSAKSGKAIKL